MTGKQGINCACCGGRDGETVYSGLTSVYTTSPYDVIQCLNCSNIITQPKPSPGELDRIYSETYLYPVHMMALGEKRFRAKQFADFLRKIIPPEKGIKLLEIGCMYGYLLEDLCTDYSVKGIEISRDAVIHCQANNLDVRQMSAEQFLEKPGDNFDVIVLSHVFEHLQDPSAVLAGLKLRLNPGGRIFILVPNNRSFCRRLFGRNWGWWQVPVHINHYNEHALKAIATSNGMSVSQVRYRGGDSLMLLLNFMNLFGYRNSGSKTPGAFQRMVIGLFTSVLRYWYFLGDEEVGVVLESKN